MSLLRVTAVAVLAAAFTAALGCNFILNPEHSDDILRCGNAIDCEGFDVIASAVASDRLQAKCDAPGGDNAGDISQANENQVCSVVDKEVSCAMKSYGGTEDEGNPGSDRPYVQTYTEAISKSGLYVACAQENMGLQGCKPMNGLCLNGLQQNANGVCDVPGADLPAYEASAEVKGQDVRDQFCRSYFCDDQFACSHEGNNYFCRRCDASKPIGEGGCGDLYFNAARSTVYVDGSCPSRSEVDKTEFGPVPTPAP